LATGNDDTAMDFGKRAFAPHPLAKLVKVSKKLLRASAIDIANLIADRFAYKFGITEENAFFARLGRPTAARRVRGKRYGISTARDANTAIEKERYT
jgi:HK97 family phage major capsid protein